MSNENEILEGEIIDTLPKENSVYVDRTGRTYDATKGVRMSDLPQAGVIQLPRTTWYGFAPKPVTAEAPRGGLPERT